jgi:hypothetical protein
VLVRGLSHWHCHHQMTRTIPPTLQAEREAFEPIPSVHPFVVHLPALPLEQDVETAVTIAYPGGREIPSPHAECGLIPSDTSVAVGEAVHRDHTARLPLANLETHSHKRHQLPALAGFRAFFGAPPGACVYPR